MAAIHPGLSNGTEFESFSKEYCSTTFHFSTSFLVLAGGFSNKKTWFGLDINISLGLQI